jgi:hypothetical protein
MTALDAYFLRVSNHDRPESTNRKGHSCTSVPILDWCIIGESLIEA